MFRASQRQSSGALKTVTATVAVTVFSAPDDGRCDARNMQSDSAVNKCLHTVASSWTLLTLNQDARNYDLKKKKNYKCGRILC